MKKFKFTIAGQPYDTTVNEIEPNVCEVTVNGTVFQVEIEKQETVKKKPVVAPRPAATGAATTAAKPAAAPASAGTTVVKSPLPGSIVKVMVQAGQEIKKGDTLLTMESMKMENVIASEVTGKVKSVLVQPGQNVMQDDKLVEIEVATAAATAATTAPQAAPAAPKAAPAPAPAPAPKAAPAAAPAGGTKVTSPLPGSVIKVLVSEGQAVKKGDTLLTLESMKMENAIMAECDGTVSKIAVTAGQNVMQDDLLVVLN